YFITPQKSTLKFKLLSTNATAPTKATANSAGIDLYSAHDYVIRAKGKALIKTDIQLLIPPGCYGRIAPRSGLAFNHFIDVGA
ncbi:deoxyuridine 5', partial [Dinothrombium tinctorium]